MSKIVIPAVLATALSLCVACTPESSKRPPIETTTIETKAGETGESAEQTAQKAVSVPAKPPAPTTTTPEEKMPDTPEVNAVLLDPSLATEEAPATYRARFETSAGNFVVECHRDWAPKGADRFYNLVKAGLFNDVRFFRVIPNFMVQFGINGDPKVSAKWKTANIQDDPVTQPNDRGYITFATSGSNSRTSQVFINFKSNRGLDGQGFAPFGQVVEGMDSVDAIHSGHRERPNQGLIQSRGNEYLNEDFPELDYITTAVIE
jgi:peptidyl-prolyl cis-trans isomerase A (cyclophilin A)